MIPIILLSAMLVQTPVKEKAPEVFSGMNFPRPSCGWNGDLQQDGKCHVRIVFTTDYPTITCKVRTPLPEKNHEEVGQIIDCTWEPIKENNER